MIFSGWKYLYFSYVLLDPTTGAEITKKFRVDLLPSATVCEMVRIHETTMLAAMNLPKTLTAGKYRITKMHYWCQR